MDRKSQLPATLKLKTVRRTGPRRVPLRELLLRARGRLKDLALTIGQTAEHGQTEETLALLQSLEPTGQLIDEWLSRLSR